MNQIEEYCKRFTEVFDASGKNYLKHFTENAIAYAMRLEKENEEKTAIIESLKVDCEKCSHKKDGLYTMVCFECKHYHGSQFEVSK